MRRLLPTLLLLLPLFVGLGLFFAMRTGFLPDLLWSGTFEIAVPELLAWIGGLISLAAAVVYGVHRWGWRRLDQVRQKTEAEQRAERRRFLRRLDHELKNPLLIVRLAVDTLQQPASNLSEEQQASLKRLVQQSQRLQRLVEGLRLLAELDEAELERARVLLPEVLEEAIALGDGDAAWETDVVLRLQQVPWPVGALWGDRDLLVMAFHNLLDNARKFSGENGRVEVRASEDGGMAVVEIADTGVGIPAEEAGYIFDELYRAQNARGVPGSGLGLALVQRIVELHGGEIRMRSRVGQGTVVSVRLPLATSG